MIPFGSYFRKPSSINLSPSSQRTNCVICLANAIQVGKKGHDARRGSKYSLKKRDDVINIRPGFCWIVKQRVKINIFYKSLSRVEIIFWLYTSGAVNCFRVYLLFTCCLLSGDCPYCVRPRTVLVDVKVILAITWPSWALFTVVLAVIVVGFLR